MLELLPLMEMQSWRVLECYDGIRRCEGLTSPHVTTQFLMTMSLEFQLSKPSVLTVLYCELEVAFMSRLVIVMFCEYATNVCLSSLVTDGVLYVSSTHQNWGCLHVIPSTHTFLAFQSVKLMGLPAMLEPFLFTSYHFWPLPKKSA
jgi:hypothetical protein